MKPLEVVRVDTVMGSFQLFIPLKRGPRKKLDISGAWGEASIRFHGPNQLDIVDQSVLLAVLRTAQLQLKMAQARGEASEGARGQARKTAGAYCRLEHAGHRFSEDCLVVETSYRELARLCGKRDPGGSATALVQECLARLTETTVWMKVGRHKASSRLLAWEVGDDERVRLWLNWRLVEALCGRGYSSVSLDERLQLPDEVSRALHFTLSCRLDVGKPWRCHRDKLQMHVWGDVVGGDALRYRRTRLVSAVVAIGALRAWHVNYDGDMVEVLRKGAPKEPTAQNRTSEGASHTGASYRSRGTTLTPLRRQPHDSAAERSRPAGRKPSNDAGSGVVDASVLFITIPS